MFPFLLATLIAAASPATEPTLQWFAADLGVNTLTPWDGDFKREHKDAPALTMSLSYSRFLSSYLAVTGLFTRSSSFHLSQQTPSAQSVSVLLGPGIDFEHFVATLGLGLGAASLTTQPGCHPESWNCENVPLSYVVPHLTAKAQALYFPLQNVGFGLTASGHYEATDLPLYVRDAGNGPGLFFPEAYTSWGILAVFRL